MLWFSGFWLWLQKPENRLNIKLKKLKLRREKVSFVTEFSVTFEPSVILLIALSAMSGTNGLSWSKLTAPSLEIFIDDISSYS